MLGHPQRKKMKKRPEPVGPQGGVIEKFTLMFATAFWSGYFPAMPGTAGSFVGLIIWYFWGRMEPRPFTTLLFVLGIYVFGVFITSRATKIFCEADHNLIVWDEMLGMIIATSFLTPGLYTNENRLIFAMFLTYRLLNILKPFPLKKLQALPGGWGVMTDDVASGVITLLIFYLPLQGFWAKQLGLTLAHVR